MSSKIHFERVSVAAGRITQHPQLYAESMVVLVKEVLNDSTSVQATDQALIDGGLSVQCVVGLELLICVFDERLEFVGRVITGLPMCRNAGVVHLSTR